MRPLLGTLLLAVLILGASSAIAQDLGDLSGSIDVSKVDAEVDGERQDSLRQLYTINYFKYLTSYIDFRAGLRYYDFNLDAAEALGSFQEEVQPSAELSWSHPWFRFTATGSRRISRSPAISGKLINDSVLLDWESRWVRTPVFGLRYELRDLDETGSAAFRNTLDQRLTGSASYEREHETLNYEISRIWTKNVIRGVETTEYSQRLQYLGAHRFGEQEEFSLSSQYRYTRVDRTSAVATGERLLVKVEPDLGLGAVDPTPDQGPLPPVAGLIDGNTLAPVAPPLGIGAGDLDRNIGVDLGVRRSRVGAIYVYVDRLSAATVTWTVWISDDNLIWDNAAVSGVLAGFNSSLSRYEIQFDEVEARFIKVVNGGVNAIPDVQVTEIEVFESQPDTEDVDYDASSHLADARLVWDINPRWQTSIDMVGRYEPATGSVPERLTYDYGLRARFQQTARVAHVARWGQSWQDFENSARDLRDDDAGYSFLYDPLPTLGGTVSAGARRSLEGGLTSLRSANALVGAHAIPWRPLRTSFEAGVSRIEQPIADYDTDVWQTRLTFDGEITRQLRALITWTHQESFAGAEDQHRIRRGLRLSGELQITTALFARAGVDLTDDAQFLRSEDYLVSWRLFTRLLLTGQINTDEGEVSFRSNRYALSGTLDLFNRFLMFRNVTIYVRFSDVDQREAGGSRILSWQQGLRATF